MAANMMHGGNPMAMAANMMQGGGGIGQVASMDQAAAIVAANPGLAKMMLDANPAAANTLAAAKAGMDFVRYGFAIYVFWLLLHSSMYPALNASTGGMAGYFTGGLNFLLLVAMTVWYCGKKPNPGAAVGGAALKAAGGPDLVSVPSWFCWLFAAVFINMICGFWTSAASGATLQFFMFVSGVMLAFVAGNVFHDDPIVQKFVVFVKGVF